MSNPVLVENIRGHLTESVHRGSVVIADADGDIRFARGDILSPICPRSALKPIQALPLIESGAAEAFRLSDEDIALACGSHAGEEMHIARLTDWLKRIDCSEADLACGPVRPRHEPTYVNMMARGIAPTRLHNPCSGKHIGFLTLGKHIGAGTVSYIHMDHPVQQRVLETIRRLCNLHQDPPHIIDDCAAPNFCINLTNFARALAQIAGYKTSGAKRVLHAMTTHPEMVAGTGRASTKLTMLCEGRAAVKNGAEGVYAAMVPESGLGIALKIDDGDRVAAETAMAAVLAGLGLGGEGIMDFVRVPLKNTRGVEVGERRSGAALSRADLTAI